MAPLAFRIDSWVALQITTTQGSWEGLKACCGPQK